MSSIVVRGTSGDVEKDRQDGQVYCGEKFRALYGNGSGDGPKAVRDTLIDCHTNGYTVWAVGDFPDIPLNRFEIPGNNPIKVRCFSPGNIGGNADFTLKIDKDDGKDMNISLPDGEIGNSYLSLTVGDVKTIVGDRRPEDYLLSSITFRRCD